jgi:hypothetical protein
MTESKFEKYAVRKPVYEAGTNFTNRQSPTMTFMSEQQTGASCYIEMGWIYGIPQPNPGIMEHTHDYDEIILHWGGDYKRPQVLGAEIEIYIGGQPINFNTTCGIYIPAGTPHGPMTWKKYEFPHIEMTLILGTGDKKKIWDGSTINSGNAAVSKKTRAIDYEQYVVRSPMREAGEEIQTGRQTPTMTYMSRTQVPAANTYIEFGWIWECPKPGVPKMVHDRQDEIVMHIGGDPQNPEDLGADMEFGMGDDLLQFNTSYAMWIPKGQIHGPLNWHKVRKPHIEMAIHLGLGTQQETKVGSYFGADELRMREKGIIPKKNL